VLIIIYFVPRQENGCFSEPVFTPGGPFFTPAVFFSSSRALPEGRKKIQGNEKLHEGVKIKGSKN
jgi:hypothetical protein